MTYKTITSIFIFFLFISCSTNNNSVSGEYKSIDNNLINDILYNNLFQNKLLFGYNLKLNTDSTYVYTGCAQIYTGKWSIKNDSLKLQCEKVSFKIDSLDRNPKYKRGLICNGAPTLVINKNTLVEKVKIKNNIYSIILKKEITQ